MNFKYVVLLQQIEKYDILGYRISPRVSVVRWTEMMELFQGLLLFTQSSAVGIRIPEARA